MIAGLSTLRGGELSVAITSTIVGFHNAHLGRGPKTARTFHQNNMIVTVMGEAPTPRGRLPGTSTKTP